MQLDPFTDKYPSYTPYQFAGCEPIETVDLDGLEPVDVLGAAIEGGKKFALLGNLGEKSVEFINAGVGVSRWATTYESVVVTAVRAARVGAVIRPSITATTSLMLHSIKLVDKSAAHRPVPLAAERTLEDNIKFH